MRFIAAIAFYFLFPASVHADTKISTYLEGVLKKKTKQEWVIETAHGIYWVALTRPPNWVRKTANDGISFWVRVDQIKRFRPNT